MKVYNIHGNEIIDLELDDNSFHYEKIMREDYIQLNFSLVEHVELPLGAYCIYNDNKYYINKPSYVKKIHNRYIQYTAIFEHIQYKMKMYKFINIIDGRLSFSLCGRLNEHISMLISNMNNRDITMDWNIGYCFDTNEKNINYDNDFCDEALHKIITEFDCEYKFDAKTIHIYKKIEYNTGNPLTLSYGQGNGLRSGVIRKTNTEKPPIEKLYAIGGKRNIDRSSYNNNVLLLPKRQIIGYDGVNFSDEQGFVAEKQRKYISSGDGKYIYRYDRPIIFNSEESIDCQDIYPSRIGVVSSVIIADASNNMYDIIDDTIPDSLDFSENIIDGEKLRIIFQSGMLAGKEFEVRYLHNQTQGGQLGRRFEIVSEEIDGIIMPNETYIPTIGDKYIVLNCKLPQSYICDNINKVGASWEMYKKAVKRLYDIEDPKFTFIGEIDGIWAKSRWNLIENKLKLFSIIIFRDNNFLPEGVPIRIVGVKTYFSDPHSPVIELADNISVNGFVEKTYSWQNNFSKIYDDNEKEISKKNNEIKRELKNVKNIRQPKINEETNTWVLWNEAKSEYEETKIPSIGKSSTIKVVKDIKFVEYGEEIGVSNDGNETNAILRFTLPLPPKSNEKQLIDILINTQIDGKTKLFELAYPYVLGTSNLYYNGLRQRVGVDYIEYDDTHFEMVSSIPKEEEYLIFEAIKR